MSISSKKLLEIKKAVGLPEIFQLYDEEKSFITDLVILRDGRVLDLNTKVEYSSPSAMRADLISSTGPTYKYFFYCNHSLKDLMKE